jgi:hypothetical protein
MGDKTHDGYEVFGKITGLSRDEMKGILADVRANHKTLDECPGPHEFSAIEPGKFGSKHRCAKCGGTIGAVETGWYRRGLEHGGRPK